MAALNEVTLIGNVGKKADLRTTKGGISVANFSLATNETYTDKDNNKHENTEWHNIVCFGKLADIADKYCTKGKQIWVRGSLTTDEWTDKDNNKRQTTKIKAQRIILLGSKNDQPGQSQSGNDIVEEDDIPF